MKKTVRVLAVFVALGIALPLTSMARESNEPSRSPELSEFPEASESPRASGTMRPSKSPKLSNENESEDVGDTHDITVPKSLKDDVSKLASSNHDIRKVDINAEESRVEVKYRLRAKLFGVIDVPYELRARVDTKAKTIVAHGPWWLLFARDNVGAVKASLSADESLLTARNQGTVLSKIISILKALAK